MTSTAILMMLLFMLVLWGGLAASIFHLTRHTDETSGVLGEEPDATDDALYSHGN